MKCISLHQPWASLVVIAEKRFETRSWPTKHRGPILIHAAKRQIPENLIVGEPFWSALGGKKWSTPPEPMSYVSEVYKTIPLGCIIGVAEVVDVQKIFDSSTGGGRLATLENGTIIGPPEIHFGDYKRGRYAWKLTNPRRFANPIPFRGMQQIFNVPDEIVAEQLKGPSHD